MSSEREAPPFAKHRTFAPGSLEVVFEALLDQGERQRNAPDTAWGVDPLLDEPKFSQWLENTAVLDYLSFSVKLPNPDADEAFREVTEHLQNTGADLVHALRPRDKDRGISKDLRSDTITNGLLEMADRAFAVIRAKGRSAQNRVREYNQRDRVRTGRVKLPDGDQDAQRAVGDFVMRQDAPGTEPTESAQ